MIPSEIVEKAIASFLASIEQIQDAYTNDTFSFIALRVLNEYVLIRGTLYLNVQSTSIPLTNFESANIYAGHFRLADVKFSREEFIKSLLLGEVITPRHIVRFPPNSSSKQYGARFDPFHEIANAQQRRMSVLSIFGDENARFLTQPDLDWELRAAPTPYDGLHDLLLEFQPGVLGMVNTVEVIAYEVAAIDLSSAVDGETAHLIIRTALSASQDQVAVGYRIIEKGKVIKRSQINGKSFVWSKLDGGLARGAAEIKVPPASIVHAIISYHGLAQQHYFFGDPNRFQNPRRAIYEAFDPKCAQLNEILAKARSNRPAQRDFEAAMPWLFWMLGFAPAHIGKVHTDAADFIMAAPNGHIAVAECTVGILKKESKLAKLHARTDAARKSLELSNATHIRVLPVIVTAKTIDEIRPEIEQAEKSGIFVISRELIDQLINRTLYLPNADQIYEEAEKAVAAALERREAQLNLTGLSEG